MTSSDGFSLLSPGNTGVKNDYKSYQYAEFQLCPEIHNLATEDKHEINLINKMNKLLREGNEFYYYLYSSRGLSSSLIQTEGNESTKEKEKVNLANFKALMPLMARISALNDFSVKLIDFIVNEFMTTFLKMDSSLQKKSKTIKFLSSKDVNSKEKILNPTMLMNFTRLIDLIVKLDLLKDMKASLLNDYSSFKRSFQLSKSALKLSDLELSSEGRREYFGINDDELDIIIETSIGKEIYKLQIFLADPSQPKMKILAMLRDKIYKQGRFGKQDAEVAMINKFLAQALCSMKDRVVSEEVFLLPQEKYAMLRAIPTLMLLIDTSKDYEFFQRLESSNQYNIFRNKAITDDKLMKIIQLHPITPLMYDMTFNMFYVIQACPSYSVEKETNSFFQKLREVQLKLENKEFDSRLLLKNKIHAIKEEFMGFCKKFNSFMLKVKSVQEKAKVYTSENVFTCTKLCLSGFRLLSKWKESLEISHSIHLFSANSMDDLLKKSYDERGIEAVSMCVSYLKTMKAIFLKDIKFIQTCLKSFIYNEVRKFPAVLLEKLITAFTPVKQRKTFTFRRHDSGNMTVLNHLFSFKEYFAKFLKAKQVDLCDITVLSILSERLLEMNVAAIKESMNVGTLRHKLGTLAKSGVKNRISGEEIQAIDKFLYRLTLCIHFNDVEKYLQSVTNCSNFFFNEFKYSMQQQNNLKETRGKSIATAILEQGKATLESKSVYAFDILTDAYYEAAFILKRIFLKEEAQFVCKQYFNNFVDGIAENVFGFFKFEASHSMLLHLRAVQESEEVLVGNTIRKETSFKKGLADSTVESLVAFRGDWSKVGMKNFSKIKNRIILLMTLQKLYVQDMEYKFKAAVNEALQEKIKANIYFWLKRLNKVGVFNYWLLSTELNILQKAVDALKSQINIPSFEQLLNEVSQNKHLIQTRLSTELLGKVLPYYKYSMKSMNFEANHKKSDIEFPRAVFSAELVGSECVSLSLNALLVSREDSVLREEVIGLLATSTEFSVPLLLQQIIDVTKDLVQELYEVTIVLQSYLPSFDALRVNSSSEVTLLTLKTVIEGWLKDETTGRYFFNFSKLIESVGNCLILITRLESNRTVDFDDTDFSENWLQDYLKAVASDVKLKCLNLQIRGETASEEVSAFPSAFARCVSLMFVSLSLRDCIDLSDELKNQLSENFGDGTVFGSTLISHFIGVESNKYPDFVSHLLCLRESEELFGDVNNENNKNVSNRTARKGKHVPKVSSFSLKRNTAIEYLKEIKSLQATVFKELDLYFKANVCRKANYTKPMFCEAFVEEGKVEQVDLIEEEGINEMESEEKEFCV